MKDVIVETGADDLGSDGTGLGSAAFSVATCNTRNPKPLISRRSLLYLDVDGMGLGPCLGIRVYDCRACLGSPPVAVDNAVDGIVCCSRQKP